MGPTNAAGLEALIAREFPIREHGVYANHAALSPWPRSAAEAVRAFAAENAVVGPAHYRDWIERERRLRGQLAKLICTPSADDVALLKNTTEGISTVAAGLAWASGDNIVLPAAEFPSNRLPWLAQQPLGVTVREVDIRAADNAEEALISALDDRTRLLSVSAVQWNDGFRLDLGRLGAACRQRGVLFFVDAIQHLGALRIDVTACRIDFLAADAHKWLLGPEGIAVFFSTPAARDQLRLVQQGWHMVDNPWAFDRKDWTPSRTARRFEAGSPNTLGQAAFAAALEVLLAANPAVVEQRVLANSERLVAGLVDLPGVRLLSRVEPARRSGIVTFQPVAGAAAGLHGALRELGIDCAVRGQGIRLSPHFYQSEQETGQILAAIEKALHRTAGGVSGA